ncbi:MAG: hypothetical protein HQK51_15860 [Oligoflexia bacterium]|nr:hypothetical protein [Oligoflexia bacterium]
MKKKLNNLKNLKHLWRGNLISDSDLENILFNNENLLKEKNQLLNSLSKFKLEYLYNAFDKMIENINNNNNGFIKLQEYILSSGRFSNTLAQATIKEMLDFCNSDNLKLKIAREFNLNFFNFDPYEFQAVDIKASSNAGEDKIFECFRPLGIITHITPGNALSVGPLSVVEGLLTKNINILKASHLDSNFAQFFFEQLLAADESNTLKDFINIVDISSKETEKLKAIFSLSDGVVAWGGENSMEGVKSLMSATTPLILFGPKISIAYFTQKATQNEKNISDLCDDIILMEQEACSSPQIVYLQVEDDDRDDVIKKKLDAFADKLFSVMEKKGSVAKSIYPTSSEQGEITLVVELHRLESLKGHGAVLESTENDFRILLDYDYREELRASPLFRTIWLKAISLSRIISTFSSKRNYLQTAAVAALADEWPAIVTSLYDAGITRITPMGQMLASYSGEPHDGAYTLPRLVKKVSLKLTDSINALGDLHAKNLSAHLNNFYEKNGRATNGRATNGRATHGLLKRPLMSKEQFQAKSNLVEDKYRELYFRSGGSSGEPKFSFFTYDDYHKQMSAAADGLLALGLNPKKDLVMNLFYAGGLYGGFLSFFTILEKLKITQLPMAAYDDLQIVAQTIKKFKVNVIMGMPSYIISLFQNNEEFFKQNAGIVEKIYYGGEHFNQKLQNYFKENFKIKLIKSASYGSVDAGPLGYQCKFLEGGGQHLHSSLHNLEILKMDKDEPVDGDEIGRLVFTSKVRKGQNILRYEIGDLGRYILNQNNNQCLCGRTDIRFELLGRYGDIFKAGGPYLNYQSFLNILQDHLDFKGEMQILLETSDNGLDLIKVCINEFNNSLMLNKTSCEQIKKLILNYYQELGEIYSEGIVCLEICRMKSSEMIKTAGSGKLKNVIDLRE